MLKVLEKVITQSLLLILFSCTLLNSEKTFIDDGEDIRFIFEEGLNEDVRFQLPKDKNGFYFMDLEDKGQTIQRISVKLLRGNDVVETKYYGRRNWIYWSNNLYWWLREGETVANISKTYFSPFTGEIQYVNLPPLINWKDEIVPTINPKSLTDDLTGRGSTVIEPLGEKRNY